MSFVKWKEENILDLIDDEGSFDFDDSGKINTKTQYSIRNSMTAKLKKRSKNIKLIDVWFVKFN